MGKTPEDAPGGPERRMPWELDDFDARAALAAGRKSREVARAKTASPGVSDAR